MNQSQSWFHAIKIPVEPKCDYGTCCRGWKISAELPKLKFVFISQSERLKKNTIGYNNVNFSQATIYK